MLQAKKMELSQRLQKEIANHLIKGKFMLAKIKVQTVIRYEATQEAMEIIEMLCEQILERYGLFEEMKELDPSLEQAISSLIWVSPYMRSEVGKRIGQNKDTVEITRFPSAPNSSVTMEDVEDPETFEGYGSSLPDTSVSWIDSKKNDSNDDSVNKGDSIFGSVSGRHDTSGTFNANSRKISDSWNKEVPTTTEIRSNLLRSTRKKKCNLRVNIPTIYDNDSEPSSLEEERQNFSKKTEYSNLNLDDNVANDFEDNNDLDQPPSYETVVCNTTEDNLDIRHPYQFEVDIKLECFPQYPTLPTCPTLNDMSEERFENTKPSYINGNSEKDRKTYSDKKKTPT
ncbi:IST1 like protein [Argiope bruennichi]|uniref:IST1 homolog n=1 Tax=Argiope bruennichi TaxID=94029 RepID=A0A8T0E8S3_ARGBR|nr:IST1 like protein [Argiope bruennichi]